MTTADMNKESALTSEEAASEVIELIKRAGLLSPIKAGPTDAIMPALTMKNKFQAIKAENKFGAPIR